MRKMPKYDNMSQVEQRGYTFDQALARAQEELNLCCVTANGWYFSDNWNFIGTFEECLDYLGFDTKEEYEEYIKRESAKVHVLNGNNFWYWEIEKMNLDTFLYWIKKNAVYEKEDEVYKELNARLTREITKKVINELTQGLTETVASWLTDLNK